MIDFHTHILPDIDDGSRNEEESLQMLRMLREQGVSKVVLSPHFYAYSSRAESFIENREESVKKLVEMLEKESLDMEIYQGCEVLYFNELWRIETLKELSLRGTEYILVEMPMSEWTDDIIDGIEKLSSKGLTPVIVHFERFLKFRGNSKKLHILLNMGAQLQMNCNFINSFFTRGKALSYFKKGLVSAIGSDCHNTDMRPPNCGQAYEILRKKLSKEQYSRFEKKQMRLLKFAEKIYPVEKIR